MYPLQHIPNAQHPLREQLQDALGTTPFLEDRGMEPEPGMLRTHHHSVCALLICALAVVSGKFADCFQCMN